MDSVFIWQEFGKRWFDKVREFVKAKSGSQELTLLHCNSSSNVEEGIHVVEYMMNLCKELRLIENNITFLSLKDHLLALELCISTQKSKNEENVFEISGSELLACHKNYTNHTLNLDSETESSEISAYKTFLKHCNCTDFWQLYLLLSENKSKIPDLTSKNVKFVTGYFDPMVLKFLKLISGNEVNNIIVETPLDISLEKSSQELCSDPNINIHVETVLIEDAFKNFELNLALGSATVEYAEDIMVAFFNLLVNSRNELALSKVITSPIIDLSHTAFTDLKHISLKKDMPMCQTVMSYVMKLRLGGKGYAPPENCPLLQHLKGLEVFVDLLNKLQTIVEEVSPTTLALKRLINVMKNRFLNNSKLEKNQVEEAAEKLLKIALEMQSKIKYDSKVKSSQYGQETINILKILVNHLACTSPENNAEDILEQKKMQRTPLNLPPLLGYFRSPEEDNSVTCHEESQASTLTTTEIEVKDPGTRTSYFHSNSNSTSICTDAITPVKTLSFQGCLTHQQKFGASVKPMTSSENQNSKTMKESGKAKFPNSKRSILSDVSNNKGNAQKRKSTEKAQPAKKIVAKGTKAKQIQGQGTITRFFSLK